MRLTICSILLGVCLAATVQADTVFLKSGEEIEGDVIFKNSSTVTIKEKYTGNLRSISRTEVDIIIYNKEKKTEETKKASTAKKGSKTSSPDKGSEDPSKKSKTASDSSKENAGEKKTEQVKTGAGALEEPEKPKNKDETADASDETTESKEGGKGTDAPESVSEGAGDAEGESKEDEKEEPEYAGKWDGRPWPVLEEKYQEIFDKGYKLLASDKGSERKQGKSIILSGKKEVVPEVIKGIYHTKPRVRTACAEMLGDLRARNAIQFLVEALYASTPKEKGGKLPEWQRNYFRALKVALVKTTGKSFINVEVRSPLIHRGVEKYIEWYNKNWELLPKQVGEPTIDPLDPQYMEKLKAARQLKLVKKDFPRVEVAQGLDTKVDTRKQKPLIRQADKTFKKSFPKVDREKGGGVFREEDKGAAKDFFNE